jgi:hypothetical protein
MCFQEFSVVLIVLGVHNIFKRVETIRKKFCTSRSQRKDYFTKHLKLLALLSRV